MGKFRKLSLGLGVLALFSGSAFATPIGPGVAHATGTILIDSAGISFSNFASTGPDTGSYMGTTSVTQGNLPGPPTVAVNITDWVTFNGPVTGAILFDLQEMDPGFGTLAPCFANDLHTSCTPSATSPITLVQISANEVLLFLHGGGIAYNATGGTTQTVVDFTSQNYIPGTITGILAAIHSENGFTDSVLATYTSTVSLPEPMTFSTMAVGFLGLGLIYRRRKKS